MSHFSHKYRNIFEIKCKSTPYEKGVSKINKLGIDGLISTSPASGRGAFNSNFN